MSAAAGVPADGGDHAAIAAVVEWLNAGCDRADVRWYATESALSRAAVGSGRVRRVELWLLTDGAARAAGHAGEGEYPARDAAVERVRRADPRFYTADGVFITQGLRVWDNDLKAGSVDVDASGVDRTYRDSDGVARPYWDGWFVTRLDGGGRGMSDTSRLSTVHPVTREAPPEPPPVSS